MKIQKNLQTLVQTLARKFRFPYWPVAQPPGLRSQVSGLGSNFDSTLDQPTDTGLPLREALPVQLW
jgi:hypothetical protein